MKRPRFLIAYSFTLVTFALFLFAWLGQFAFQLIEVQNQAQSHGDPFVWSEFLASFFASTLENWQSEFLQLCWQAGGLAFLLHWGSSQSREGDERLARKIDLLLRDRGLDPEAINDEVVEEFGSGG